MAGRKIKKKVTLPAHAPAWSLLFLQTLGGTGNVTAACKAADVSRKTVYKHRNEYPEFEEAWENSLEEALDKLEGTLWKIGASGNTRAIELVLKARRPIFREGHNSTVQVQTNVMVIDGQDPNDLLKDKLDAMKVRMVTATVTEEDDEDSTD